MKLLIVESPSKSKTIENYLGSEYKVVASLGHIRDLRIKGKGGFGVDVENNALLIKGAIPGAKKGLVTVRSAVKTQRKARVAKTLVDYTATAAE